MGLVWLGTALGAVGREDVKMENYKIIVLFLPVGQIFVECPLCLGL